MGRGFYFDLRNVYFTANACQCLASVESLRSVCSSLCLFFEIIHILFSKTIKPRNFTLGRQHIGMNCYQDRLNATKGNSVNCLQLRTYQPWYWACSMMVWQKAQIYKHWPRTNIQLPTLGFSSPSLNKNVCSLRSELETTRGLLVCCWV